MNNPYLEDKAAKKSFLRKGIVVLVALAIVFTIFMTRFALSGTREDHSEGAPNSDDAYSIAKVFIKPTIKSSKVSFPESGYQCAQKPDSIFIVKSYAESKGRPESRNVTTFEITLKFNGGKVSDKNNWKVIGINEN